MQPCINIAKGELSAKVTGVALQTCGGPAGRGCWGAGAGDGGNDESVGVPELSRFVRIFQGCSYRSRNEKKGEKKAYYRKRASGTVCFCGGTGRGGCERVEKLPGIAHVKVCYRFDGFGCACARAYSAFLSRGRRQIPSIFSYVAVYAYTLPRHDHWTRLRRKRDEIQRGSACC